MSTQLYFDVSAGLKSVIGRDLITNDEVAIFELVKNSFDAQAKTVQLYFSDDFLIVLDDGVGMTLEEIRTKWLFVAYSSKSKDASPISAKNEYRSHIADRRQFAGSKGIGRFSSDRIGSQLTLQTVSKNLTELGKAHELTVDWNLFEQDKTKQFASIPVAYREKSGFELPSQLTIPKCGTAITISGSRTEWTRTRILSLKSALAKLINPFGAETDGFSIKIIAPGQLREDKKQSSTNETSDETSPNTIVNGDVGNFIFSSLTEKTTFINVTISNNGNTIETTLTDRGEVVYKIREPNSYPLLSDANFHCQIYYLNQSAKATFARRMGVPSVQFGSIFLFRNGFRVYPVGEEGDDTFGIDRRKQQGYARYLGSRDIIGRLDVQGDEASFKEASSRNQGLVNSPAVAQMLECFWEYCFKRLERYVVPVTWADSGEKSSGDLSRLLTDSGRARVTNAVARLIDSDDVEVVEYSKQLINVLNERSSQFEESILGLRAIALKTSDFEMAESLDKAERRFNELKLAEAEALRLAEEERFAKQLAQREAAEAVAAATNLSASLTEEKKRTLFLASITAIDVNTILNMHHQITIYAADLKQQVENCMKAARQKNLEAQEIVARLEQVAFLNQKVLSVSRMAIKANFRLDSDKIEADLAEYIDVYIREGAVPFLGVGLEVIVNNNAKLIKRFRPIEASIIIDNLINNAKKARSTKIVFDITAPDKKSLEINVADNGTGFSGVTEEDLARIFELGFSRTSGSGLGLYHVRQALGEMDGSISVVDSYKNGAKFNIKVIA